MHGWRRSPFNSRRSSWTDGEGEDDSITPCAPLDARSMECHPATSPLIPQLSSQQHDDAKARATTRPRSSGSTAESSADDDRALWECMLRLQRQYGCYNSARMRAALSLEESGVEITMPSRACLEILNDSIEDLPDEGWDLLEQYGPMKRGRLARKTSWMFWRR